VLTSAPLRLGENRVWPPVVLAPMAGITNTAFRSLCREYGAGLYVSEMVTSRALVERDRETMRMVAFQPDESPRSLQLYGVDPAVVGEAVRMVVGEDLADHVDLNFGCPVPKVTRKGGGSALPYKRRLFGRVVEAAVAAADGRVPVTVKMRKGIDDDHLTFLDAGRIAQAAGVAWVALHGRTAAQMYSGRADWDAISQLVAALDVPVLGNGDIWEAADALRMMAATGCAGVVVGRGCLGRPWLFGDLATAFDTGVADPAQSARPGLAEVARVMRRHAELLALALGDEGRGCRDFRKHVAWYLKGFRVGSTARSALAMVGSLGELDELLATLELDQPFPEVVLGSARGRTSAARPVSLPEGWLGDPECADARALDGAELALSGG
jgi:nifR3 family TIM-barrel protein